MGLAANVHGQSAPMIGALLAWPLAAAFALAIAERQQAGKDDG